ncbi:hypothetical protein BDQ12DRAFT_93825 [Crucibulum laeve]|uniref:Copper-fist domain-containing protein n=1 Tax=Crucibulum laeve TaxID=68775 RepID=A0A5C3LF22_9AGAR|nr:hypothetical protein BDQ12DRAFT_93825 [Crucibulum laeve]
MVFISTKKYACETCIKGHRSSACKHTDRPLFEIKKKGRPVTQCEHCRELRKTKQVHVKCLCESKVESPVRPSPPLGKKGNIKVPESAAFPNGLPQALEASVAQQLAEGASSDSDHGGIHNSCSCSFGGECHCCTPRKGAPRSKRKQSNAQVMPGDGTSQCYRDGRVASSANVMARMSELRPVLPRPTSYEDVTSGPFHDPSSGVTHGHSSRHHDNVFSPYGRAYDHSHQQIPGSPQSMPYATDLGQLMMTPTTDVTWSSSPTADHNFTAACDCGENCGCAGCFYHMRAGNIPISGATCTNPGTCNSCFDCTILSLPSGPDATPNTALSIPSPTDADAIDEWVRQVSFPQNQIAEEYTIDVRDEQNYSTGWNQQYATASSYQTRLSPHNARMNDQFLTVPDLSRSRSPSTSSQSSREHVLSDDVAHPYSPTGRVHGYFGAGARSMPQLSMGRPAIRTNASCCSSTSVSSSPAVLGAPYAVSNPDSEGSSDDYRTQYEPSFEGLRIH